MPELLRGPTRSIGDDASEGGSLKRPAAATAKKRPHRVLTPVLVYGVVKLSTDIVGFMVECGVVGRPLSCKKPFPEVGEEPSHLVEGCLRARMAVQTPKTRPCNRPFRSSVLAAHNGIGSGTRSVGRRHAPQMPRRSRRSQLHARQMLPLLPKAMRRTTDHLQASGSSTRCRKVASTSCVSCVCQGANTFSS